jgi:hypothetical protein
MQAELGLQSSPVPYGFRHTGHEMWTDSVYNSQSRRLFISSDMLFLKFHEERLVHLDHPFS